MLIQAEQCARYFQDHGHLPLNVTLPAMTPLGALSRHQSVTCRCRLHTIQGLLKGQCLEEINVKAELS